MNTPTFFEKILSRKVLQYLGTYLAVGFGLLQFLEFVSKRFGLVDFWVDAYLIIWLAIVPAVSIMIYYRGLPPVVKGGRWKRWLVFTNLLLAVVLSVFLPSRSTVEANTQTVETTNESGEITKRTIPSASAVKRIGVFEAINDQEDEETNWWGTAFALLLKDNLHQRPEIIVKGIQTLNRYYSKFEVPIFGRINLATQRKIAERANTDYFVRIRYTSMEDNYELFGSLYRTRDGKEVKSFRTSSESPFRAIDNIKEQIFDFLPPLGVMDEATTELPVSALITDSPKALEFYTKGVIAFSRNPGDLPPAVAYFRQSVRADPSCAPCLYGLADKLYGQGKTDTALTMITKATKLAEVLPEREQFGYKRVLLNISGQYEGSIRLSESALQLYPYEFWPYASLVNHYEKTFGVDSAIVLMTQAVEVSDQETALNRLYGLYMRAGDFGKAEEIIRTIDEKYADTAETRRRYASFYQKSGEIDKARSVLKEMLATDPTNMDLQIQLASLEIEAGYYDNAEELLEEGLRKTTSRSDSITFWNYSIRILVESGQIRKALSEMERYERYITKEAPVNVVLLRNYPAKVDFAGRLDNPMKLIDDYDREMVPYNSSYFESYRCSALVREVILGRAAASTIAEIINCEDMMVSKGAATEEMFRLANLMLAENYAVAADLVDDRIERGTEVLIISQQARIQRLAGRAERGLALLEEKLKVQPNDPRILLEKARILLLRDDVLNAKVPLISVLKTWRNADPDHTEYQEARQLAEQIGLPLPNETIPQINE